MSDSLQRYEAALEEAYVRRTRRRRAVGVHAVFWLTINTFLFLIWLITTGPGTIPWFLFPAGGTAVPLALHAASAFLLAKPEDLLLERDRREMLALEADE